MASSYAPFSTSVLYAACSVFRVAVRAFVFAYARLFAAFSRSRSVLEDGLDAVECAGGGRNLGDGLSLEEGGAAVLVADDRAVGHLGGEVHEALDGGDVRHGWFLFLWRCPVDVSFTTGRVVWFSVAVCFPPTTCSLHV